MRDWSTATDISEAEQQLFITLGDADLLVKVPIVFLYRKCAEDCFIANKQGPAVDSLRRCLNAVNKCDPFRNTKEFDNLIILT